MIVQFGKRRCFHVAGDKADAPSQIIQRAAFTVGKFDQAFVDLNPDDARARHPRGKAKACYPCARAQFRARFRRP